MKRSPRPAPRVNLLAAPARLLGCDADFMHLALAEARKGLGRTRPNPCVGAVLVRAGRLLGAGYHRQAGLPHAEVEALTAAGCDVSGATLYCTLEPCNHHGRTGPCTERIIAAGIARVVVGAGDPNPRVNGAGVARLRAAGIDVVTGVLEALCRELNAGYNHYIVTGRPLVIVKAAVSLDGRLATRSGQSAGLSGPAAQGHLHQLRASCDAIAVGVGTVLVDDPLLTARPASWPTKPIPQPLRIVLDSRARTPPGARLFSVASPLLIATTALAPVRRLRALERAGAEVLVCRSSQGRVSLAHLIDQLGRRELMSLLVEGGGQLHGALWRAGRADKLMFYLCPRLIGGDGVPLLHGKGSPLLDGTLLRNVRWTPLGDDMLIEGSPAAT